MIRAIGQPRERFAEDKLRLLRAVRFAVRYGFAIEPATREQSRKWPTRSASSASSGSRWSCGSFCCIRDRAAGIELLDDVGLLAAILPTVAAAREAARRRPAADDWTITLDVLDGLDRARAFRWRWPLWSIACSAEGEVGQALGDGLQLSTRRNPARLHGWWPSIKVCSSPRPCPGPICNACWWPTVNRRNCWPRRRRSRGRPARSGGHRHCREKLSLPPDELDPLRLDDRRRSACGTASLPATSINSLFEACATRNWKRRSAPKPKRSRWSTSCVAARAQESARLAHFCRDYASRPSI